MRETYIPCPGSDLKVELRLTYAHGTGVEGSGAASVKLVLSRNDDSCAQSSLGYVYCNEKPYQYQRGQF